MVAEKFWNIDLLMFNADGIMYFFVQLEDSRSVYAIAIYQVLIHVHGK